MCPAVMNALRWCIVHSAFLLQERHNKASVKFMNSEFCGIWNHNMKGEESFSSVNIPLLAFFCFSAFAKSFLKIHLRLDYRSPNFKTRNDRKPDFRPGFKRWNVSSCNIFHVYH